MQQAASASSTVRRQSRPRMTELHIRLPPHLLHWAQSHASAHNVSLSRFVAEALGALMRAEEGQQPQHENEEG